MAAELLTWLDKLFGASNAWASPTAELVTQDQTAHVLAEYDEPASQKTTCYRVSITAEETPVNNAAGSWVLTRSWRNASGVVSAIGATETTGGDNAAGFVVALERNATTKKIEVRVTGLDTHFIHWRCARLETA